MYIDVRKFEKNFCFFELKTICTSDNSTFLKNPRDIFVFRQQFGKKYSPLIFEKEYQSLSNDEKIALCYVHFHKDYYSQFLLESRYRPFRVKNYEFILERNKMAKKIYKEKVAPYFLELEKKILKTTGLPPHEGNPNNLKFQRKKQKLNKLFKPLIYYRFEKMKVFFKEILFRKSFQEFNNKIDVLIASFETKNEEEINQDLKILEENSLFDFYREEIYKKLKEIKENKKKKLLKEKEEEQELLKWLEFEDVKPNPLNDQKEKIKKIEKALNEETKPKKEIEPPSKFDFSKIQLVLTQKPHIEKEEKKDVKLNQEKQSLILITPKEYGYKECSFVNLIIKKSMSKIKNEDFEFYKYAKQRGIYNYNYLKMKNQTTTISNSFLRYDKEKNDFYIEENLEEKPRELLKELECFFCYPMDEGYRNSLIFCNYFLNNQSGKNVNKYKTFCKLIICDIFNEIMKKQGRFLEYRKSLKVYVPKLLELINIFEIEMTEEK